jgi:hypothetical protein
VFSRGQATDNHGQKTHGMIEHYSGVGAACFWHRSARGAGADPGPSMEDVFRSVLLLMGGGKNQTVVALTLASICSAGVRAGPCRTLALIKRGWDFSRLKRLCPGKR